MADEPLYLYGILFKPSSDLKQQTYEYLEWDEDKALALSANVFPGSLVVQLTVIPQPIEGPPGL
jgi:hypothetical protein